ncbi:MAG: OsmC family protein [Promethearchaeota archaeon]
MHQNITDQPSENVLNRVNTIYVRNDLQPITIQLPIGYNGPKNDEGLEIYHTPEDLYLGALSGCLFTTFSVVASNSNFRYDNLEIQTEGIMDVVDDVKMMTEIHQTITLTIPAGSNPKKAQRILEIAEKRCPLANSVKTKIINDYRVKINQ